MSTKTNPIDQPTRGSIERLLRELADYAHAYSSPPVRDAQKAYDDREKELRRDRKLTRLRAKLDQARDEHERKRRDTRDRLQHVRQRYLAEGLTSAVLAELRALVAFVNIEKEAAK